MSVAAPPPAAAALPLAAPARFRWTAENFARACEVGVFPPGERWELLEGELYQQMSENPPHVTSIQLAVVALTRAFSVMECHLRVQHPLALTADSQPEPDVAVAVGDVRRYASRHPAPQEVLLVVEVSATTLDYDRNVKGPAYAAAGVTEYWIVNLAARQVEVYRQPQDGVYGSVQIVPATGQVSPLAVPQAVLAVADLLP